MTTVRIDGLETVVRRLEAMGSKQVRFAAAMALTRTAQIAHAQGALQLRQRLDRPTRFAVDALFLRPASKDRLQAMIHVKDGSGTLRGNFGRDYATWSIQQKVGGKSQADVLGHLFAGGKRLPKNYELAMLRTGLLPSGMATVPGSGAPLDANGNIPRGFIVQMLAYFRQFGEQGYRANMTDQSKGRFERRLARRSGVKGVEFFVVQDRKAGRGLHPGIWQRVRFGSWGRSFVRPIIMFVPGLPSYRHRFDLQALVQDAYDENWQREFREAWDIARRTAR